MFMHVKEQHYCLFFKSGYTEDVQKLTVEGGM